MAGRWHSRLELYEMIWAEPVSKVAPRYGISDVALRKICERVRVPIPERGYWAKLRFQKEVKKTPLPPRGPGVSDKVFVGSLKRSWYQSNEERSEPFKEREPSSFPDDIQELAATLQTRVGNPRVPNLANRTHPVIAQLLEEDDKRRSEIANRGPYAYNLRSPRFSLPADKRRLRIANALFLVLDRLDAKPDAREGTEFELGAVVGDTWVPISIEPTAKSKTRATLPSTSSLTVKLPARGIPGCEDGIWNEFKQPIERQIGEIAASMIVAGELLHRERETKWYERWIEVKKELEELERKRRLEAERREAERRRAEEQARVDGLLAEAEQFRRAADVRAYVSAARQANCDSNSPVAEDVFEAWAKWAIDAADKIDPILSGMYARFSAIEFRPA